MRLNEKEFETMKWSLTGEQLDTIQKEGKLELNKQQMIDTLKSEIKGNEEMLDYLEGTLKDANDTEKEFMKQCIEGGKIRNKEMKELLSKLEATSEDVIQGFRRG